MSTEPTDPTSPAGKLGRGPGVDLSDVTTLEERLEMVLRLSMRMWELTGQPLPQYTRATMPIRVLRLGDPEPDAPDH